MTTSALRLNTPQAQITLLATNYIERMLTALNEGR
jgi:hypothetical protein